jgi:hypothetical protein
VYEQSEPAPVRSGGSVEVRVGRSIDGDTTDLFYGEPASSRLMYFLSNRRSLMHEYSALKMSNTVNVATSFLQLAFAGLVIQRELVDQGECSPDSRSPSIYCTPDLRLELIHLRIPHSLCNCYNRS